MHSAATRIWRELGLAMMGLILAGCGEATSLAPQAPVTPGVPVFYPPSPARPRLQFLMSFSSIDELTHRRTKRTASSFEEFIVGKTEAPAPAGPREIQSPYGIAARNGRVYICDLAKHCVHVIDVSKGAYSTLGGPRDLRRPVSIRLGPDGRKYVCDTGLRKVVVFGAAGQRMGALGDPSGCTPADLAILDGEYFVADIVGGGVQVWSPSGKLLRTIVHKGKGSSQLQMPSALGVGTDGRIYVTDRVGRIVKAYRRDGQFLGSVGGPGDRPGFFGRPKGLAIDSAGRIYVADAHWEVVQIFSPDGRLLLHFGGPSAKPDGMGMPAGIAIDATSIPAFREYIHPDFQAEYLVFVANQFGKHKIGVYAFGHSRSGGLSIAAPASPPANP